MISTLKTALYHFQDNVSYCALADKTVETFDQIFTYSGYHT